MCTNLKPDEEVNRVELDSILKLHNGIGTTGWNDKICYEHGMVKNMNNL